MNEINIDGLINLFDRIGTAIAGYSTTDGSRGSELKVGNSRVKYDITPNSVSLVITTIEDLETIKELEDYKEWIEKLDDEIFVKACEDYQSQGYCLNELSDLIESGSKEALPKIEKFKEFVYNVIGCILGDYENEKDAIEEELDLLDKEERKLNAKRIALETQLDEIDSKIAEFDNV